MAFAWNGVDWKQGYHKLIKIVLGADDGPSFSNGRFRSLSARAGRDTAPHTRHIEATSTTIP